MNRGERERMNGVGFQSTVTIACGSQCTCNAYIQAGKIYRLP